MTGLLGGYWAKKFFFGGLACFACGALLLGIGFGNAGMKPLPLGLGCVFFIAGVLLLRQWKSRKNSPEKKLTQGFLGGYWSRKYILGGVACLLASAAFLYDGFSGGSFFYAQNGQDVQLDQTEAILTIVLNFLGPFGFAAIFFGLGVIGIRIGILNKKRLEALENDS